MLIFFSIAIGLAFGWVAEFVFKSITRKKITWPIAPNVAIYGAAGGFAALVFLYWQPSVWIVAISFLFFSTGLEYAVGSYYLIYRHVRLYDYSDGWIHYRGLINPMYSLVWTALMLIFYYKVLPLLV